MRTCSAPNAGYRDGHLADNKRKFEADLRRVFNEVKDGDYAGVVFPRAGLGTGVAALEQHAPLTFAALVGAVEELKERLTSL